MGEETEVRRDQGFVALLGESPEGAQWLVYRKGIYQVITMTDEVAGRYGDHYGLAFKGVTIY